MKILLLAAACTPYLGSEAYFGWSAVKALSADHEIHVITDKRFAPDIARAAEAGLIPARVHFSFAGEPKPWHPNRAWARLQSWGEYSRFVREALTVAKELHAREQFDFAQHVTYATWRVASPLWKLGIPFIYGPIGGYEEMPFRIFPVLSFGGGAFEVLRKISNVVSRLSPEVRRSLQKAAHVFAATRETAALVREVRGSDARISRLLPGFYSPEKVTAYTRFGAEKDLSGPLRLFASGNLGPHKGISIALHALAEVKKEGVHFRYHLGAGGPEIPHLKRLVNQLGLTDQVYFGDTVDAESYQRDLGHTHLYLLPSLRESVGLTMMEAMLARCVPIVADCGGPNFIVTDECGFRIRVTTPARMSREIARTILTLHRDREMIRRMGAAASRRIVEHFTESNYQRTINEVYRQLKAAAGGLELSGPSSPAASH